MGLQASFYLSPDDMKQLESNLRASVSFVVIHSRSQSSAPKVCQSLGVQENGKEWLFLFLARKDDVPNILMKNVSSQNYWTVDSLRSPVVEFTRSFFDGARLRAGRVHYDAGSYSPDGIWVQKNADFLEFAESILKILKKNLKKTGNYFVGDDAARLRQCGSVAFLK